MSHVVDILRIPRNTYTGVYSKETFLYSRHHISIPDILLISSAAGNGAVVKTPPPPPPRIRLQFPFITGRANRVRIALLSGLRRRFEVDFYVRRNMLRLKTAESIVIATHSLPGTMELRPILQLQIRLERGGEGGEGGCGRNFDSGEVIT